jgi:hypothetical protein
VASLSQIGINQRIGNGMMMDPNPHPQHMKIVNHLHMYGEAVGTIPGGFGASTNAHWFQ